MGRDDRSTIENRELNFAVATNDITIYFNDAGTDTATTYYMGLYSTAKVVIIRPTANIIITEINNQTLKEPITVTTSGFSWSEFMIFDSLKFDTQTVNTNVKITAA